LLQVDFPDAVRELEGVLADFSIEVSELVRGGGGEASITQRLRRALAAEGWEKENFQISKSINGVVTEATTHEIDHVKTFENGTIALEIEWNNKDPFYDRDLENFKRLHGDNAISMGIIITRGKSLQPALFDLVLDYAYRNALNSFEALDDHGVELTRRKRGNIERGLRQDGSTFADVWAKTHVTDKYGQATTHWKKFEDRLARGVGNPCPLVGIGLPVEIVRPYGLGCL
jgi:hypothetical protein